MPSTITIQGSQGKISQARDYLLQEIKRGSYSKGQKIPTETMLTQSLGISRNTIREAVSSLVHDGILERRQGSGTYVLNNRLGQVNRLSQMKVARIGIVVQGGYHLQPSPYLLGLVRGVSASATGLPPVDIRFLVADSAYRGAGRVYFPDALDAGTVDALVFSVVEVIPSDLDRAMDTGIPIVFMGNEYPNRKFPCVRPDLASGVAKLTQFLHEAGRKDIGLLLGRPQGRTAAAFLSGLVAANSQLGREPDLSRVAYTDGDPRRTASAVDALLDRCVKTIMCYDDDTALETIRFLTGKGIRVPHDIAVTGANDTLPPGNESLVPLTTLRIPLEDIGRAVRDFIFDGMRTGTIPPRTVVFEPELVIRQSAPE